MEVGRLRQVVAYGGEIVKTIGIPVVSLQSVNCRFWSHLRCLGWKVTIFANSGIAWDCV